jgi:hypothetical protein
MDTKATALLSLSAVVVLIIVMQTVTIKVNYNLVAYVLFASVMIISMLNLLYRSERIIAAVAILVLFILVFTFFGLRWFKYGITSNSMNKDATYPPVINTCPDYMSLTTKSDGTTKACIDTVGLGVGGSTSRITTWRTGTTPQTATSDHYFNFIYRPGMSKSEIGGLKDQAIDKKITWEGVTDGLYQAWA